LKLYSLPNALEALYEFIFVNADSLLKSEKFLEAKKDIVMDIVKMDRLVIKEEQLFHAIFKWAAHQAKKQANEPVEKWFKQELSDILPHIRFPVMDMEFLHSKIGEYTCSSGF
jgi:hypothetical protein